MHNQQQVASRRNFIKGFLAGGLGAMTISPRDIAAALLSGKTPSDVHGWGVEPGQVKVGGNENPLGPSPRAVEAVARHLFSVNRYGGGTSDLIRAIGQYHAITLPDNDGSDRRSRVQDEMPIMVTAGSSPILHTMATESMKDEAEMIIARPGYTEPALSWTRYRDAKGLDLKIRGIRLDKNYTHDLELIYKAINNNTSMVAITNPHNPTSTIVSHGQLKDFVDSVPPHVLILLDEAYIHFVRDPKYKDAVHIGLEKENVAVARTFSKGYGMAGMRVGYGIMSPKLISRLKVHMPRFNPMGYLGVVAAEAAIGDTHHIEHSRQMVQDGEDFLAKEFEAMGFEPIPSHSNFMWVDIKRDATVFSQALRELDVSISDGKRRWGMDQHVRITIGTRDENEALVWAMQRVLS